MQKQHILAGLFFLYSTVAHAGSGDIYMRLMGGANKAEPMKFSDLTTPPPNGVQINQKHGVFYGGAIGYQPEDYMRVELELSRRENEVKDGAFVTTPLTFVDGQVTSTALMGNAYFDFKNSTPFTPYAGFGIGGARVNYASYRNAFVPSIPLEGVETKFAYQAMAGLSYALSAHVDVNIEYRYFATNQVHIQTTNNSVNEDIDYRNSTLLGGLTYKF